MAQLRPAVHRTILVVDVEGFGAQRRTSPQQVMVRDGLYRALRQAFRNTNIPWADCYREDRGDGVVILAPAEVPKRAFVEFLPHALAEALHTHNRMHRAEEQIRLRMALHAGEVNFDDHGVTSASINTAFRLLEARPLRAALAESHGALALITSSWFFDEVIRSGPVSNSATYRPVRVVVKETTTVGWISLPDQPYLPGDTEALSAGLTWLTPRQLSTYSGPTRSDEAVFNEVSGVVSGSVIQARDIQGGVHFHRSEGSLAPVPQQLPSDISLFVGRETHLAKLDALLDEGDATRSETIMIAAISGMGGIGKTALAVHWAHRVRERFPDGQLYINLRGREPEPDPLDPGEALAQLLRTVGVPVDQIPHGLDARAALYRSLLANRRMLIVLDDARSPEQVRPLLPSWPSCLVIVTSRSRLSGLVVREGAHRINLDVLSPGEAIMLLRQGIGADRVDNELDAAAELARSLGYLPLALRVVAARFANHSYLRLGDLVNELTDARGRLDVLDGGEDVGVSIRAVISWSYQALPSDTARAFRLLSLCPSADISDRAAAALLGTTLSQAKRLLGDLARTHLLIQHAPERYLFHDLLHSYAVERVMAEDNDGDQRSAVRRVLTWYLQTADAAGRVLAPQRPRGALNLEDAVHEPFTFGTHDAALRWCEAERTNLVGAVQQAAEHGAHDIAWRLPVVLWDFFNLRKYWGDWITTSQIGLDSARQIGDRYGEAAMLHTLGNVYYDLRRFDDAIDYYRRAWTIRQEIGDRYGESWTLNNLGTAYQELRRFDAAVEHYQRALVIRREIGDRWGQGWTLNNLGEAYQRLQQVDTAIGYYQQALGSFHEISDRYGEGFTLDNLGLAYGTRSQFEEAIYSCQRALDIRREIGDRWGEGWTLNNLGTAYRELGRFEEAIEHYERALEIRREIGDRWGEGWTLDNLGTALHYTHRVDRARSCWQAARTILEDIEGVKETDTPPRTPRQARIWCVNDEPIQVGQSAHVAFAVTAPHGVLAASPGESPDRLLPHPVKIRVLLHSAQASVRPVTQVAVLEIDRTTDPVLFEVVPTEAGPITLVFRVYLDRDGQLLQEIRSELPVTQSGRGGGPGREVAAS
jgi:tetratricopeptide (TPR) repeat protein